MDVFRDHGRKNLGLPIQKFSETNSIDWRIGVPVFLLSEQKGHLSCELIVISHILNRRQGTVTSYYSTRQLYSTIKISKLMLSLNKSPIIQGMKTKVTMKTNVNPPKKWDCPQ